MAHCHPWLGMPLKAGTLAGTQSTRGTSRICRQSSGGCNRESDNAINHRRRWSNAIASGSLTRFANSASAASRINGAETKSRLFLPNRVEFGLLLMTMQQWPELGIIWQFSCVLCECADALQCPAGGKYTAGNCHQCQPCPQWRGSELALFSQLSFNANARREKHLPILLTNVEVRVWWKLSCRSFSSCSCLF